MLNKNDEFSGVVSDIGSNGEGVIKQGDFPVFTPFLCLGEEVVCKVLKCDKNFAYGKTVKILKPSQSRVEPKCEVFGKCGGCQLQHMDYAAQLSFKRDNVKRCFSKICGIDVKVEETERCEFPYGYRNKLQLPVGMQNGETVIGFYAENSHRIIPVKECPINPVWTASIISSFYKYVKEFSIKGYDSFTKKGDLREITVKDVGGKLIITAVVLNKNIRGLSRLVDIIKENVKREFSLYINVNTSVGNVVYGKDFYLVYGEGEYRKELLGVSYSVGVQSFMQVNDFTCKKLYSEVIEKLSADENTTVIDAYSGAGLMTALAAKNAQKAIGIEIVKEAVECADNLAKMNALSYKIKNYCGKCEELLPDIIEKEKTSGSKIAVILDPPRKGCDIAVIEAVKKSGADKIVYVSCMPSTLARDVGIITGDLVLDNGKVVRNEDSSRSYSVEYVKPFDMFPMTKHIETIVLLKLKTHNI